MPLFCEPMNAWVREDAVLHECVAELICMVSTEELG